MPALRTLLLGGTTPASVAADLGFTALRLFTGLTLAIAHGWGKLADPGTRQFLAENMVGAMGFPQPMLWVWMVVLAEFFGGLLLAAGLLTRAASLLILINMLVAGVGWHLMHAGDPFSGSPGEPSAELALVFAAIAFAFMLAGSGRFSVDSVARGR
jgi:putative oxidoreductase